MVAKEKTQRKKTEPLALLASAGASVTSMIIGSLFGDSGTIVGTALGSVVSGVAMVWYENAARLAGTRIKGRWRAPDATQIIPAQQLRKHRKHVIWSGGALLAGILFAGSLLLLSLTEAASGKTLHGLVTGKADYGTTLGGSTPTPPPSPRVTPNSPSPSRSATQSSSPGPSPSTSSSGSSSPSPSPSGTLVSPSPSSTPSVFPSSVITSTPEPDGSPIG